MFGRSIVGIHVVPGRAAGGRAARAVMAAAALLAGWLPTVARGDAVPQLVSAASRREHGAATFDVPLPLAGPSGIECRVTGGARGSCCRSTSR
jgi:hypothetical protein